jgi:hypothetical protein
MRPYYVEECDVIVGKPASSASQVMIVVNFQGCNIILGPEDQQACCNKMEDFGVYILWMVSRV